MIKYEYETGMCKQFTFLFTEFLISFSMRMNMKQECVNNCITMVCGVYNMRVFPDILKK